MNLAHIPPFAPSLPSVALAFLVGILVGVALLFAVHPALRSRNDRNSVR